MRSKFLIANWKMNLPPGGIESYLELVGKRASFGSTVVGIAPPFPFIADVRGRLPKDGKRFLAGAQNCSEHASGAYTGEVAAVMAGRAGAEFILAGHSERRTLFAESDELTGRKVGAILAARLDPLLCIGEDLATRENGATIAMLARQLEAVFRALSEPPPSLRIAYEPVWAIGTGRNATPEMAAEAHLSIRRIVGQASDGRTRPVVLYGGSVKPDNAAALAAEEEIEGFLVGGASLDAEGFLEIGRALDSAV